MNPPQSDYERLGWQVLGPIVTASQLDELRDGLSRFLGPDPDRNDYGILRNNIWTEVDAFGTLVRTGALARAASLAGPTLRLFQDNLVYKPAGTMAPLCWHQDFSYWPLDRPSGCTLWLALDDTTPENGCLHYLPGTHLLGERQPAEFIQSSGQPGDESLPPLDWRHREATAVAQPLKAGEALIHHPLVWHMSPGNRSSVERRGLSVTFLRPEVRWSPDHAPHPYNYHLHPTEGEPVTGELFPLYDTTMRPTGDSTAFSE
ncbi:MAG: phytanoyl-CoA hydroxylase [Myxococcota bacterium]|jgi:phytanoyl-CoA hydroxylase